MTQNLFDLLIKACETRLKFNHSIIITSNNFYENLNKKINKNYFLKLKNKKLFLFSENEVNVFCTISLVFSVSNTRLSVITPSGKVIFSVSSGSLGLKGKQKINRYLAVKTLLKTLNQNYPFLIDFGPSLALHITNAGFYRTFVIKIVKMFFLVTSIKIFDLNPYNGCRKKKIRRKKIVLRSFK